MKKQLKIILVLVVVFALSITFASCQANNAPTNQAGNGSSGSTASQSGSNGAIHINASNVVPVKAPKNGDKYVIGVSLPSPDNAWVTANIDNAQKQAEAANASGKFDIKVTTANNPAKQVSDVEDLLTRNPDVMVIFPIESAPLTPISDQIKQQGIPLIVLTRGIDSQNYDTFIHGDDKIIGVNAANYIGKRLNGKGNVVVMQSSPSQITTDRTQGFLDTIAKYYPDLKVVATGNGNFARDPAMKEMENILQAQSKIDAVYSMDDDMTLGCIAAIKAAGRDKEMFITGCGGTKEVLQLLKNKDSLMAVTFLYSPLQGGSAVVLAQLMAQGVGMSDLWEQTIPHEIVFAADPITADNAANYYDPNSKY